MSPRRDLENKRELYSVSHRTPEKLRETFKRSRIADIFSGTEFTSFSPSVVSQFPKMDVTLQKHAAKHIYKVPEGLRELCTDISREVNTHN